MIRILSVLGVALTVFVTNDALLNRASHDLFFYVGVSCVYELAYGRTRDSELGRQTISPIFKSTLNAERAKRDVDVSEAKLELVVLLDPDISEYIDAPYAQIEFCRLFSEVQEFFNESNIIIEFSALHFDENQTIDDDGILDAPETISNITDKIENWNTKYDAYLFLTRRTIIVDEKENDTVYKSGYSVVGGACRPGSNIAIATYSFKHIMHQITHLLGVGAVDATTGDVSCNKIDYIEEDVVNDVVSKIKGISKCTEKLMKDFLNTTFASCLYSEDVADSIDCENIIPEIRLDDTLNLYAI